MQPFTLDFVMTAFHLCGMLEITFQKLIVHEGTETFVTLCSRLEARIHVDSINTETYFVALDAGNRACGTGDIKGSNQDFESGNSFLNVKFL